MRRHITSLSREHTYNTFWDTEFWEPKKFAENDFNALKSVGIFHDNPKSAANQVNRIWENVDKWWHDACLQAVRREFCEKYACRKSV